MNILDWISLAIIGISVVICAMKGLKKVIFRVCAFAVAAIMAKLLGARLGNFLLSDIITFDKSKLDADASEKIYNTLISTLGTLIVFLTLFFILKKIFRVVEGKMGRSLQSIVIDRLCGALVGLFLGVAFVFVFTETVSIVFATISLIKRDTQIYLYIDNSIIFKLFRNLN